MTSSPDDPTGDPAPVEATSAPPAPPAPATRLPTPGERLLERADALAAGGLPMDAVAVYRQLLAAEPEHLEGRLHLARLLVQLEELEGALAVLNDALRHAPDQTEFLVLRGGLYANLRLYPEADTDLRRVLRLYPSHAPAHLELGRLLWRKGLAAEAAVHFRRSLEFQPDNPRTCYYLGDALNQAGDLAGASAALEQAIHLDPHDAKAHYLLGRVLDRLGHPEQAAAMYQRSRELAGA
jgi:tetratricopeptide (TPR) repeat protein